jgi:hypothetical protein
MPNTCICCEEAEVPGSVELLSHRSISICYRCLDWLNMKRIKLDTAHSGPMRVAGVEPIFTVSDVARSVDHYKRLGMGTSYHDEGYAFAHWDNLTIHLAGIDEASPRRAGSIYVHVEDADAVAEAWRKAGLEVTGPEDYD